MKVHKFKIAREILSRNKYPVPLLELDALATSYLTLIERNRELEAALEHVQSVVLNAGIKTGDKDELLSIVETALSATCQGSERTEK